MTRRLNELQRANARTLRQSMTKAEVFLWQELRRRRLDAFRFRRQHPIGVFIADFACVATKVVIEIDGMSHEQTRAQDEQRQKMLEATGWQVVRYSNEDVLQCVGSVAGDIDRVCRRRQQPPPYPPPGTGEDTRFLTP
jgi:very-short-patch-repair endonuclease